MRKERETVTESATRVDEVGAAGRAAAAKEDLTAVWQRYKKKRCPRAKETLIIEFLPLVKYVAGRLAIGLPPSVEMDDLIGSGTLGLLSAVERYDPSRDNKFSTYAIARIRGSMLDELRSMDWIPRSVRKKARQVEEAYSKLESRLKRPATDDEVARELSVTVGDFLGMLDEVRGTALVSLDDQVNPRDGGSTTQVHETVQDHRLIDPGTAIEVEKMRRVLEGALDMIPERERLVIILYYYEELTLKEIGDALGVSESRVSQIHTKAVLSLRGRLRAERDALLSAGTEGRAIQNSPGVTEQIRREYAKGVLGLLLVFFAFFSLGDLEALGNVGGLSDGRIGATSAGVAGASACGVRSSDQPA